MRLPALFALVLTAMAVPAAAHDFWIDLPSYRAVPGATLPVRLLIGDTGAAEPWEVLWRKIVSLRSFGPGGVIDHQASIRPTTATDPGGASVTLTQPGTHIVAFESYQAESDLPAAEFNPYAEHEGLTPAIAQRRRDGTTEMRGRELYSRRAKAIVQVGDRLTDDAIRPIGQTLEIVPEANPYGLVASQPLVVRILYRGRPLAGASVTLEPLDGPTQHMMPVVTDGQGRATFAFAKRGRWRIATVWTQPIDHPRAEFDTIFASLTFGY